MVEMSTEVSTTMSTALVSALPPRERSETQPASRQGSPGRRSRGADMSAPCLDGPDGCSGHNGPGRPDRPAYLQHFLFL